MKKPVAIGIAVVAGVVAVAAPIAASLYWAQKQNLEDQMASAESLANEVLRRFDRASDQSLEAHRALKAAGATNPCSEANIRLMRRLVVGMDQLKVVGYVANDHIVCSSYGRHDDNRIGIPIGPPTYRSNIGTLVRTSIQFALVPGMTFLGTSDESTGYIAMIPRDLPLQIFVDRPDIAIGVFSSYSKKMLTSRGEINEAWIERLGQSQETQFSSDRHVVVVKRVPRTPAVGVFAAIQQSSVEQGLRRTAMLAVPVGLAAGLVLALAVFYVTRYQMSVRSLIKAALRRHEFFLVYQPIIELRGGSCIGAEALIRWRRPDGSLVRPDLFIPVAEESGLIHEITKEVMLLVARDASRFLRANPRLHIAINLSAKDLAMAETGHLVKDLILGMGVRADNIMVEATERGFMQAEVARRIMDDIHSLQVKIAIDDFGTGYSSLSYLEKFKLDYLKIDKSFVDTMGGETATSQVAPHIIEMAKSLKLEMIAEGVETEAQVRYLQQHGVQYAQGYFYAKPMPFAEFAAYVAKTEKMIAQAA